MEDQAKVADFIVDHFLFGDREQLDPDASLLGTSIIDSTGVLEIVAFLEKEFGITVNDDELIPENLDTLSNLARFLAAKRAAGPGEPLPSLAP